MTNKEKYRFYCIENSDIPVFSQSWWMDAVAEEDWDVLLYEIDGKIYGSMVYYLDNSKEIKKISKAPLTQNNGIHIRYLEGSKYWRRLSFDHRVVNGILDQLEQLDISRYEQNYHYSFTNWIPLYWRGYEQTTRYTYVIEDTSNLEHVMNEFSPNTRKMIRKGERLLHIKEDISLEEFYENAACTYKRQELKVPFTYETLYKIEEAAKINKKGMSLGAYDRDGRLNGVVYYVWDESSVYYLISGADPDLRHNQPQSLLIMKGIELAHKLGKKFDFEGSMLPHIEPTIREFGGVQKPYYRIYKDYK